MPVQVRPAARKIETMSHNRHYHRLVSAYETDRLDFAMRGVLAPEGTPTPERVCGQCARYRQGYCETGMSLDGYKMPTHDVGYLWPACNQFTTDNTMEKKETPTTKVCKRCGRELPADQFNKHARSRDGLQPYCKDCQKVMARADWDRRKKKQPIDANKMVANPAIQELPDHALVVELRRRGYDVTCKKTIEL